MSIPQKPKPCKLTISLFMQDKELLKPVSQALVEKFGNVDIISKWLAFDYTSYYEPEMGAGLFRRVLAFKNLIEQISLSDIKIFTNSLEKDLSINGKRRINIDPGYMLAERFVLATGKNFTHRIYIDKGIYADLTLIYQKGSFKTLDWTYPDYADEKMLCFLKQVRKNYLISLNAV
ncbi:DUF4416 family protein [Candidatus Magnetomoraceae bacterium gMMP-15]